MIDMNKKRREIIAGNRVSRMMTYNLGGYEQKVLLDGKSEKNPVVLFLHGGPGGPVPFSAGCRGMYPQYTENFIMAYWDQLGCGINDHPISDDFVIEDFVDMTVDLIKELKKEFPENKLVLFGVSWGSVLSARAAARVPELIDGVMVYGHVLKDMFFNEEVFKALSGSDIPEKVRNKVAEIKKKETYEYDDVIQMSKLVGKYTEGYQSKTGGRVPILPILWGLLTGPDYTLKNFIAVLSNGTVKNRSILTELIKIDLRDTLRGVRVPYRILQGGTDIVTSTTNIAAFVQDCGNDKLSIRVLDNNAHMPGPAGMEEVLKEGIDMARNL